MKNETISDQELVSKVIDKFIDRIRKEVEILLEEQSIIKLIMAKGPFDTLKSIIDCLEEDFYQFKKTGKCNTKSIN